MVKPTNPIKLLAPFGTEDFDFAEFECLNQKIINNTNESIYISQGQNNMG